MDPMPIGIIGCGNIFPAYAAGAKHYRGLRLLACADIDMDRARARAAEFGVPKACPVEELLADPGLTAVLNLTTPQHHVAVDLACLAAGKHLYSEKPLGLHLQEARKVMAALRKAKGQRLSCAPDTFLGAGLQTCRKLVDEGAIGRPVAATAVMACHGHEHWHPNPEFYYLKGGGPLFDMGPYYITALVSVLGPVKRVSGACGQAFQERLIESKPKAGAVMPVDVPTHYAATLEFANGCLASLIMSFDVWRHGLQCLQLHGTEGSMDMPDPNGFKGPVRIARRREDWKDMPITHAEGMRGAGIADLASAAAAGRPHRAGAELAFHVLEVMCGVETAGREHRTVTLRSTCERPAAVPAGLPAGEFEV